MEFCGWIEKSQLLRLIHLILIEKSSVNERLKDTIKKIWKTLKLNVQSVNALAITYLLHNGLAS